MLARHALASLAIEKDAPSIVGEVLSLQAFRQLAGQLSGIPFVKVVAERESGRVHFINNARYQFHADYIAAEILHISRAELERDLDGFNRTFYEDPDRKFYLGIVALHERDEKSFFSLETVEVDEMDRAMLEQFFSYVRRNIDQSLALLLKPANHDQEVMLAEIDATAVPRIFSHELFAESDFISLNAGSTEGRVRLFETNADYEANRSTIEWFDIVVMDKVPDDIPRISGIINAQHTTPLSHTNVLASGWQIPNCIQLGIREMIRAKNLEGKWVRLTVDANATEVSLDEAERPADLAQKKPAWTVTRIVLEEPETSNTRIQQLSELRMSDRNKFGTKAANLGELHHILRDGSSRLTGFYRVPRPPRANLLPHLSKFLDVPETGNLNEAARRFLKRTMKVPRGLALPFSIQQEFLQSSPQIQQCVGKLKMALELGAPQANALCVTLQQMIRATRMPDKLKNYIDDEIATHLAGVSRFVIRSSSNAEDLGGFSAAGIYESINHVASADNIMDSIKSVWASLISARSVRLRQEVNISLDETYMGVVIQEEVPASLGGVLVTTNPANKDDFRNVYMNVSTKSVVDIVQGSDQPFQYLFNTVEGGGRTLAVGSAGKDLGKEEKALMQDLAFAGRLLQSHFSPDYTFASPVDIEWLAGPEGLYVLQLRPYSR